MEALNSHKDWEGNRPLEKAFSSHTSHLPRRQARGLSVHEVESHDSHHQVEKREAEEGWAALGLGWTQRPAQGLRLRLPG